MKDGFERSASGGTDFGKPTSHNSRFYRYVGIVHRNVKKTEFLNLRQGGTAAAMCSGITLKRQRYFSGINEVYLTL